MPLLRFLSNSRVMLLFSVVIPLISLLSPISRHLFLLDATRFVGGYLFELNISRMLVLAQTQKLTSYGWLSPAAASKLFGIYKVRSTVKARNVRPR